MYRGENAEGSSFFHNCPTKTRRYSTCSVLSPPQTALRSDAVGYDLAGAASEVNPQIKFSRRHR
jgi:hypothetical protein